MPSLNITVAVSVNRFDTYAIASALLGNVAGSTVRLRNALLVTAIDLLKLTSSIRSSARRSAARRVVCKSRQIHSCR